ncbi:hypothetical protein LAWI1_G004421 [Lachnellula willkommii]|uniref:Peroxisomal membrane protein n=1 Tax=Lachnellula willkommii TaxID=215461 RepID=A0A559M853_9HELO|nr:hypothetical protein LAWI1_G004421 [Lachnellula willkommii]
MLSPTKILRFTNDAAGLEKTLRLLQSLTQVIAFHSLSPTPYLRARSQIALGRRYFRLLKWADCFGLSYKAFVESSGVVGVLEVGKWSCLGLYFLLELFTLKCVREFEADEEKLDAMGVHESDWAAPLFVEANKFWFYGICLSLLLGVVQLWKLGASPAMQGGEKEDAEKVKREMKEWGASRETFVKKLVIDGCDLLIPGVTTGWMVVSSANVGMAMVVSTVLASRDIWERV